MMQGAVGSMQCAEFFSSATRMGGFWTPHSQISELAAGACSNCESAKKPIPISVLCA
jgi:hypothetical protein